MTVPIQVVIDCADPIRLGAFWAEALGYQVQPPPPGYDSWPQFLAAQGVPEETWGSKNALVDPQGIGPRLFLQQVPEPKTAKNRLHLDLNVGGELGTAPDVRQQRVKEARERLEALGATAIEWREEFGQQWLVMQDPEGNEFCLQ